MCQLKVDAKYSVTNAKRSEKLNMLGSKMTIRVNIREYTIKRLRTMAKPMNITILVFIFV